MLLFAPELIVGAKALPPTIWWTCAEGTLPGSTRGSSLSMLIVEHPNRSPAWDGATSARASKSHFIFKTTFGYRFLRWWKSPRTSRGISALFYKHHHYQINPVIAWSICRPPAFTVLKHLAIVYPNAQPNILGMYGLPRKTAIYPTGLDATSYTVNCAIHKS